MNAPDQGLRKLGWVALVGVFACLPAAVISNPGLFNLPFWYAMLKALLSSFGIGVIPIGIGGIVLFARRSRPEGVLAPAVIVTVVAAAFLSLATLYPILRG